MRTKEDCRLLLASLIVMEQPVVNMFVGYICGKYMDHPDAAFWLFIEDFLKGKSKPGIVL